MNVKSEKFNRFVLWLLLAGGLLSLFIYGLSSFLVKPTVETITTHAPNSNRNNKDMQEVNYENRKPR